MSAAPRSGTHAIGALAAIVADRMARIWHGIVWYLREISGEARYGHYLEHFAAEHPGETPLTEVEYLHRREEYDKTHPNTSCCC